MTVGESAENFFYVLYFFLVKQEARSSAEKKDGADAFQEKESVNDLKKCEGMDQGCMLCPVSNTELLGFTANFS